MYAAGRHHSKTVPRWVIWITFWLYNVCKIRLYYSNLSDCIGCKNNGRRGSTSIMHDPPPRSRSGIGIPSKMPWTFINVIMGTCTLEAMSKWDEKMSTLWHISIFKHVYEAHTLFCVVQVKVMELCLPMIPIQINILKKVYSIYTWLNMSYITYTLYRVQPLSRLAGGRQAGRTQ